MSGACGLGPLSWEVNFSPKVNQMCIDMAERSLMKFREKDMRSIVNRSLLSLGILISLSFATADVYSQSVDADAARMLAKKSDCFKCHTVDAKKDGPAYREVAKKWRGKADAEQKLFVHVTTSPKVKIDGEEENHQMVKTKNEAEIYNLIRFILSLPNP